MNFKKFQKWQSRIIIIFSIVFCIIFIKNQYKEEKKQSQNNEITKEENKNPLTLKRIKGQN